MGLPVGSTSWARGARAQLVLPTRTPLGGRENYAFKSVRKIVKYREISRTRHGQVRAQGPRARKVMARVRSRDELGEFSRPFSAMLVRLRAPHCPRTRAPRCWVTQGVCSPSPVHACPRSALAGTLRPCSHFTASHFHRTAYRWRVGHRPAGPRARGAAAIN